MADIALIPAAQYLRRSTEHQQYSLDNQSEVIQEYASKHEMIVVETYSDDATGMLLKRRKGLKQLLEDVHSGRANYKVVLVYDVSRWGRFIDADEAAYYEFLCKRAGVSVRYCAEQFQNDGSMFDILLKAIKRMMAAEYSRELSAKVYAGHKRLALLGFKSGGLAGFGLRRMLISKEGEYKQILSYGQRKSLAEEHVILVPGPREEVDVVRDIFRMYVEQDKNPVAIANELNRRGIKFSGIKRSEWYAEAVRRVLWSPKYKGSVVYGVTTQKLKINRVPTPPDRWVTRDRAWEAIVDVETFDKAARKYHSSPRFKSNQQLLDELRYLWQRKGYLRHNLVTPANGTSSIDIFRTRFGSFTDALSLIGYSTSRRPRIEARQKIAELRHRLISEIVKQSNGSVSIAQRTQGFRARFRLRNGLLISLYLCRHVYIARNERWILDNHSKERSRVNLVARLTTDNSDFLDFHLITQIPYRSFWTMKPDDSVLSDGIRLESLGDFAVSALGLYQRKFKS